MFWATGGYSGLPATHVAIAGISIPGNHPSGMREAAASGCLWLPLAASGCVEGFGYDSFEGGERRRWPHDRDATQEQAWALDPRLQNGELGCEQKGRHGHDEFP